MDTMSSALKMTIAWPYNKIKECRKKECKKTPRPPTGTAGSVGRYLWFEFLENDSSALVLEVLDTIVCFSFWNVVHHITWWICSSVGKTLFLVFDFLEMIVCINLSMFNIEY